MYEYQWSIPEVGSHPKLSAKSSISIMPIQNPGTDIPIIAKRMQNRSTMPFWCVAAAIPRGIDTITCNRQHTTAIVAVLGRRESNSLITFVLRTYEVPKSNFRKVFFK
jgi:hypothetical protein